jgi:hypothetical protein
MNAAFNVFECGIHFFESVNAIKKVKGRQKHSKRLLALSTWGS